MTKKFQSTPLTRGETIARAAGLDKDLISIHSPHARGDAARGLDSEIIKISIHFPHARGDAMIVNPYWTL